MDKAQQDALKKAAGIEAAKLVENGMIAGLGTGSTVKFLVDELGRRHQEEGLEFTGVTTSRRTQAQAESYGIKIVDIDDVDHIDVTIDGADEVDKNFNGIKGGGAALLTGLRMDRTRKLERLLDKIAGDRDNIPLDELFAAAGIDAAKGRAAVESAISHGYFGADAYIDNRTATLVVRGAAPQPPKQPEPKPAPEPADQYAALLQQLRQANDAIPDPVMTAKISRLEAVSARIFELAKQDPGKKAQLQKFMDYYLPTALKLLNTYASLPAQDVQGENIADAKKNIERSMDLLVTAFENQLDKLFQSDALDVSADVAALEGMLNMDGLTGSDFAK